MAAQAGMGAPGKPGRPAARWAPYLPPEDRAELLEMFGRIDSDKKGKPFTNA